MDKIPLVSEFIEAGAEFAAKFDKHFPISAAFWLRESESRRPVYYLASEAISDKTVREAEKIRTRIETEMADPNFDDFRLKLIGINHPLAQAAIEVLNRGKLKRAPRLFSRTFGNVYADEVYIYPPAAYQSHAAVS